MFYLILVLVPLFFLIFIKKTVLGVAKNLPPGPNTWQILQKLSELGQNPHIAFKDLSKIYGPIMSLRLGGQLVVVVSSSSMAREVLRTHDSIFSGRFLPSIYYKIPGAPQSSIGMSKECDETRKFLRGLSQNVVFSSKSIESNAFIRKAKVLELVQYVYAKEGQVVDLEDVMGVTICNILSNVIVSRDMFDIRGDSVDKKLRSLVGEIIQMVSSLGISDLFPVLRNIDFWSSKKGIEIYNKVLSVWSEMVNQRRAKPIENKIRVDLLDAALESGKLSDDQICILLMEILMTGADTITTATVWLMVELMRNPEILKRVRDEIKEAFEGDVMMDETVLTKLKYFQACIKETLRLHIPGPFLLPHRATETCKIGGYVVPKESMVLINAWAIMRDPCNWNDGAVFEPERFLDANRVIDCRGTHYEFLPFGAGYKRMCPGLNVALKNIQLVVASLVHFLDWSVEDGSDVTEIDVQEKFGAVLKKEKPMCLVPIRRRVV